MARIEKTVFISYRRADRWQALAVYKDLTHHGYDVFIDYEGISAGDFEQAIIENIRARAHFVLLLTPKALERCDDPADWLRREIVVAMAARRNIVPLQLDGFKFDSELAKASLQGELASLSKYQALPVPDDYFDAAMDKLRSKRLAVAVDAVIHPASAHAQEVAAEQKQAASNATEGQDFEHPKAAAAPAGTPKHASPKADKPVAEAASNGMSAGGEAPAPCELTGLIRTQADAAHQAADNLYKQGLRTEHEVGSFDFGVEVRRVLALFYYREAAAMGHRRAKRALIRLGAEPE